MPAPRSVEPEEELALLLCGTLERRRAARGRLEDLVRVVDDAQLADYLHRRGQLGLVGTRLRDVLAGSLPPAFDSLLSQELELGRRSAEGLEMVTSHLLQLLEQAGVPAMPLKGPGLARALYGDPGVRRSLDIDLLVRPSDLDRALEVVMAAGYERPRDPSYAHGLPRLHYVLRHRGGLPAVDLHWRVHWYETRFSAAMLERSRNGPGGPRAALPADQLAAALLFLARDGFIGLRFAADVAAQWDRDRAELESGALETIVGEHPELERALRSAAAVADRLVGLPADRLFRGAVRTTRRGQLAVRMANWTVQGDRHQIMANRMLVDLLLTPRGGHRAFLRRSVFPPPAAIAAMYSLPEEARVRQALARAVHGPKLALRFVLAAARVAGGRHWSPLPAQTAASESARTEPRSCRS